MPSTPERFLKPLEAAPCPEAPPRVDPMKTFAAFLIALLLAPALVAAEGEDVDPECVPPIRVVSKDVVVDDETRIYVVQYHYAYSDYLFVYEESNGVPGVQTHFDILAGCADVAEPDTVLWGSGGNIFRYPPL